MTRVSTVGAGTTAASAWATALRNDYLSLTDSEIQNISITNPSSETTSQTNTENDIMVGILAQPTADPTIKSAWCAFTSEILGRAGLTKYLVGGYFGARGVAAENIWALNPLVRLNVGSTGNAIGIEVDVDNFQADGKMEGVTITGLGTFDPYAAIMIQRAAGKWQRGIWIKNTDKDHLLLTPQVDATPHDPIIRLTDAANTTDLFQVRKDGSVIAPYVDLQGGWLNRAKMQSGALPVASATYRGEFWLEAGGGGVADVLYVCLKSGADTYSWKTVSTG